MTSPSKTWIPGQGINYVILLMTVMIIRAYEALASSGEMLIGIVKTFTAF